MRATNASCRRSSTYLLSAALLIPCALTMTGTASAQATRAATGEVVTIRELKLKAGTDRKLFERFIVERYNPAMEGALPGVKSYIAKADRGVRKGSYVHIFVFDSERTRNAIAPTEGKMSDWASTMWQKLQAIQQEVDKYVEAGWADVYVDYVVLR